MDAKRGRLGQLWRVLDLPERGALPGQIEVLSESRPIWVIGGLEGATVGFDREQLGKRIRAMAVDFGDEPITLTVWPGGRVTHEDADVRDE